MPDTQQVQVTICPPHVDDHNAPHFDLNQFHKRSFAVTAKTGISFSDYHSMHLQRRKQAVWRRAPIPEWALNDEQLREVIVRYLEHRYLIGSATDKTYAERLASVNAKASSMTPRYSAMLDSLFERKKADREIQNMDTKLVLQQRSMAELIASVVYLSYRMGYNSVQVAEELKIKPPHVRILLYRLRIVGREIVTGKVWRRGRQSTIIWTQEKLDRLLVLRNTEGKTLKQCAAEFGCACSAVHYGFYNILKQDHFRAPKQRFKLEEAVPRPSIWSQEKLDRLLVLRNTERKSFKQCAAELGCLPANAMYAFYNVLKQDHFRAKRNDKGKPRGVCSPFWTKDRLRLLWLMAAAGKPWKEIAAALGRLQPTVIAAFNRYFPRIKTPVQTGKRYCSLQRDSTGVRMRLGIRA